MQIKLADDAVYGEEGQVDFSDSVIDRATGTVSVRAVLPNAKQELLPGQFVRVVVKGISKPSAVSVPERAIVQGPSGTFVYVLDDKDVAQVRPVVTAHTSGGRWIIDSGLKAGEQVVVEGVMKVRPNTPVKRVAALPTQQ